MHSNLNEDYLWFLVWGDGYVKKQRCLFYKFGNVRVVRLLLFNILKPTGYMMHQHL
jgi:hypothetical protein